MGPLEVKYAIFYVDRESGSILHKIEGLALVGDEIFGEDLNFRGYRLYKVTPKNQKIQLVDEEKHNILVYEYISQERESQKEIPAIPKKEEYIEEQTNKFERE